MAEPEEDRRFLHTLLTIVGDMFKWLREADGFPIAERVVREHGLKKGGAQRKKMSRQRARESRPHATDFLPPTFFNKSGFK